MIGISNQVNVKPSSNREIDFMKHYILKFYSYGCTFLIALQATLISCNASIAQTRIFRDVSALPETTLSRNKVCEIAQSITVLILSEEGKSLGSGFLIHQKRDIGQEGYVYKVVTNSHVLNQKKLYQVQTPDGAIHAANALFYFGTSYSGRDLAILQFQSKTPNYPSAQLAGGLTLSVDHKDKVIAAGFPIRTGAATSSEWVCTAPSEVSVVLPTRSMQGGYSIGYFGNIRKGMSGGPLLNLRGEVVGVNGKHSYPPFARNNLYLYENGEKVNLDQDILLRSSWAIPIETFVPLAISQGVPLALNISPDSSLDRINSNPNVRPIETEESIQENTESSQQKDNQLTPVIERLSESLTISEPPPANKNQVEPTHSYESRQPQNLYQQRDLEVRAQKFTVKVGIGNWSNRAGIIISRTFRDGKNIYRCLTYEGRLDPTSYFIYPKNEQQITANSIRSIQLQDGSRLVVLEFSTTESMYEVPVFGNPSSLRIGEQVYSAGYTYSTNSSTLTQFVLENGQVQRLCDSMAENSCLGLSNPMDEGMLGGPVLNNQGQVIGINSKQSYRDRGNDRGTQTENMSLAIPIPMNFIRSDIPLL